MIITIDAEDGNGVKTYEAVQFVCAVHVANDVIVTANGSAAFIMSATAALREKSMEILVKTSVDSIVADILGAKATKK